MGNFDDRKYLVILPILNYKEEIQLKWATYTEWIKKYSLKKYGKRKYKRTVQENPRMM